MNASSPPKSKTWLLAKSRQWHTWLGLIAALFLLIVGITGVILNYKNPLFSALGWERVGTAKNTQREAPSAEPVTVRLSTTSAVSTLPVTFEDALQIAHRKWATWKWSGLN